MRVTNSMLLRTTLSDVTARREDLVRTQEQASSGLRINRPSDDPVGVRTRTVLRNEIDAAVQLRRNQEQGALRLAATETALGRGLDVIARARELAVAGSNGSMDANSRAALAAEVEQLHGELLAAANARSNGGHIFSGYASATPPFVSAGDFTAAPAPAVSFVGDASEVEVEIEPGIRVSVTLDGRRTFLGDANGDGATDPGHEDVFAVLGSLWEGLQTNDADAVRATLDGFDRAQLQLSLERTRAGTASARVEAARQSVGDREFNDRRRLSEVEDADTIAVFSQLANQEAALQASLSAMARVIQPSLLDFLR